MDGQRPMRISPCPTSSWWIITSIFAFWKAQSLGYDGRFLVNSTCAVQRLLCSTLPEEELGKASGTFKPKGSNFIVWWTIGGEAKVIHWGFYGATIELLSLWVLRSFIDDPTYLIELFTKKEKEIMNFKKKYPIMLLEFEFVILFWKLQHLGANFIFWLDLYLGPGRVQLYGMKWNKKYIYV